MNNDLRYLADSELINRVAIIDAALLYKNAGIADSLSGVSEAVQNYVTSKIDTSSTEGIAKGVLDILSPAMFFYMHPMLGILAAAASAFDVDLSDILSKIVDTIKSKIESGEQITPEEVNAAGQALTASASADMFYDLRKIAQNGDLSKMVFAPVKETKRFYNQPLLYRIFGFLNPMKRKHLFVSFIVWFVKTVLLGAGLLATAGILKNKFAPSKESPAPVAEEYQEPAPTRPAAISIPTVPKSSIQWKSSGKGEQYFKNDAGNIWVVPIYGNVKNTLILWATEIYPELKGKESQIYSLPSFNRTASILEKNIDYNKPNYLMMPPGFNKRIDVVNLFVGDVVKDKLSEKIAKQQEKFNIGDKVEWDDKKYYGEIENIIWNDVLNIYQCFVKIIFPRLKRGKTIIVAESQLNKYEKINHETLKSPSDERKPISFWTVKDDDIMPRKTEILCEKCNKQQPTSRRNGKYVCSDCADDYDMKWNQNFYVKKLSAPKCLNCGESLLNPWNNEIMSECIICETPAKIKEET